MLLTEGIVSFMFETVRVIKFIFQQFSFFQGELPENKLCELLSAVNEAKSYSVQSSD